MGGAGLVEGAVELVGQGQALLLLHQPLGLLQVNLQVDSKHTCLKSICFPTTSTYKVLKVYIARKLIFPEFLRRGGGTLQLAWLKLVTHVRGCRMCRIVLSELSDRQAACTCVISGRGQATHLSLTVQKVHFLINIFFC